MILYAITGLIADLLSEPSSEEKIVPPGYLKLLLLLIFQLSELSSVSLIVGVNVKDGSMFPFADENMHVENPILFNPLCSLNAAIPAPPEGLVHMIATFELTLDT